MSPSELGRYPFPEAICVNREVEFGQVYLIDDRLVSIPDADRVQGGRTFHPTRRVVIIQNNATNYTTFPTVHVAPLTSRVDTKRRWDVELVPEREPAIDKPVLVRISLAQPILRADLGECLGSLSDEKQAEVLVVLAEFFGIRVDALHGQEEH